MKREAEYAHRGPLYTPCAREQAREYRPRYPVGYVPRTEPAVTMTPKPWMLRRGTPSPIHDVTEAERQRARANQALKSPRDTRPQRALTLLERAGRALMASEIATFLGVPSNRIGGILEHAIDDGRVIVEPRPDDPRRKVYRLAGVATEVRS